MGHFIYIYHHLGLGDHIICNGIIRKYTEKYDKVFNFVKLSNFSNVSFMYQDLKNLNLIKMSTSEINSFLKINPNNNLLLIGYTKDFFQKLAKDEYRSFDEGFYDTANISLEEKWNKFHCERNIKQEKEIFYNVLKLKDDEEFIFIHEDSSRNYLLNRSYLPSGVKIISTENFKNVGIFEFLYTIEKAKEVHVMASSFYCLIDTAQIETNSLFLHDYANTSMGQDTHDDTAGFLKYKLNWKIIR